MILYGSNVANGTLSTASSMSTTTGGTETSATTTVTGTSPYAEVYSRSASEASVTSAPAPSGKGWIFFPGAGTFAAGNWSASATFQASSPGTTDVTIAVYKYSSGTYTSIGNLNKTGIVGAKTTYSFAAVSMSAVTTTATDGIYFHDIWHDLSGADDAPIVFVSNSATQGVAGDMQITTPTFTAGTQTSKDTEYRGNLSKAGTKDTEYRVNISKTGAKNTNYRGNVGHTSSNNNTIYRGVLSKAIAKNTAYRANVGHGAIHDTAYRINISSYILAGQFGVFANGSGTASFSAFRATQFPDPALSLSPVLDRLGTSNAAWNASTPIGTGLAVKTSLDAINWSTATNGGPIPGINGQPDPVIDIFDGTSTATYTNTSKSGGSVATVTLDTANKRLTLAGGSGALYLNPSIVDDDIDLIADLDRSDAGGLVWRFVDSSNYYELGAYDDSSTSGFTSQLRLYKVAAGVRSLLGSASAVTWHRNTEGFSPYKRVRITMLGAVIAVYFDGQLMQTYTDGSPLGAGKVGLRNDGGTSRYYQLRVQQQGDYVSGTPAGDIVTGKFVYLQTTQNTTDPSVSSQLLDITLSARSPNIATGALIPQLHDPTKPFAVKYSDEMTFLAQSSPDYWWDVDPNTGAATFAERHAIPAPFCLYSTDFLNRPATQSAGGTSGVQPTNSADTYRNQQIITNTVSLVTVTNEEKIANGTDTSWNLAYPLYSAPTITVAGVSKTVGVKGVDTGKDFYWQPANNTISQDSGAAKIPAGYILSFSYVGQYADQVVRNNLTEQAARKAAEGGTGIVVDIVDGQGMLSSNAITYADGLLARNGNNDTVSLIGTTTRPGLAPGMVVPVFLPEFGLNNRQLLIMKLTTSGYQKSDGSTFYEYTIQATDGSNLNNWAAALGL